MDIVCPSCSTKLSIPDDRLPKNVPSVTGACPKCQSPIEIRLDGGPAPEPSGGAEAAEAPPPAAPPAAPPPATPRPPAPSEPPPPPPMEEFVEGQRLALVCIQTAENLTPVKEALESSGYKVHVPAKPEDALPWLRHNKYVLLILDDDYGGSGQRNIVLEALQPMAMSLRRHMCVGLVGKDFSTMNNMTAFAKSVNFVIAEKDLPRVGAIVKQAVADNDQFYHVFREVLREVGKA